MNYIFLKSKTMKLDDYFLGNNPEIDFPLQPHGTSFQQEVWDTIPYGELTTYGTIAKHIGQLLNKPKCLHKL